MHPFVPSDLCKIHYLSCKYANKQINKIKIVISSAESSITSPQSQSTIPFISCLGLCPSAADTHHSGHQILSGAINYLMSVSPT